MYTQDPVSLDLQFEIIAQAAAEWADYVIDYRTAAPRSLP
jgi:hypothetical protein